MNHARTHEKYDAPILKCRDLVAVDDSGTRAR